MLASNYLWYAEESWLLAVAKKTSLHCIVWRIRGGRISEFRSSNSVEKAILKGVEEWAPLEKFEKFACKRKEYKNLLEQIIRELDDPKDLERLISICRGNITEERRASIHDVRSLFKELESKNCLGIDCLEIVKEILTRKKTICLRKWKSLSNDKGVKLCLKGEKVFLHSRCCKFHFFP